MESQRHHLATQHLHRSVLASAKLPITSVSTTGALEIPQELVSGIPIGMGVSVPYCVHSLEAMRPNGSCLFGVLRPQRHAGRRILRPVWTPRGVCYGPVQVPHEAIAGHDAASILGEYQGDSTPAIQ